MAAIENAGVLSENVGLHLHPATSSHERAVAPRATIPPAVGVRHGALAVTLIISQLALVNSSIRLGTLAPPVYVVVLPHALVNSTIRDMSSCLSRSSCRASNRPRKLYHRARSSSCASRSARAAAAALTATVTQQMPWCSGGLDLRLCMPLALQTPNQSVFCFYHRVLALQKIVVGLERGVFNLISARSSATRTFVCSGSSAIILSLCGSCSAIARSRSIPCKANASASAFALSSCTSSSVPASSWTSPISPRRRRPSRTPPPERRQRQAPASPPAACACRAWRGAVESD